MQQRLQKSKSSGFSLIEMIVVIGAGTLVLIAVASAITFFYRTNSYSVQQAFAITSASDGVKTMVRDIREASYAETGAYPIENMSTSSFTFFSDVDRDDTVEKVRYFLDGNDFKRSTTKPTSTPPSYTDGNTEIEIISENVRNNQQNKNVFEYFDEEGRKITDLTRRKAAAFVTVNLIVNVDAERKPDNFTVHSSASLRNLHKPS